MEIPEKEVFRYLNIKEDARNERTLSLISELIDVFNANIVPKSVFGIWDCKINSSVITLGDLTVKSKSLAGHLTGCRRAALLAATLGPQADVMVRRYSVDDMEKAVIAQSVGTAMIEAYCDIITDEIACKIENGIVMKPEACKFHLTSRYSPGYGDFDINFQKDIFDMLNCSRIGLTLTSGYMMIPSKSVTAVVGFNNRTSEKKQTSKCADCGMEQCGAREAV